MPDLINDLRIWFFAWMDTCTAAGMSEVEAKVWIARRWKYLKFRSAIEGTN
jgi:hypothetical protein